MYCFLNVVDFNSSVSGLFYDVYLVFLSVGWGWFDFLKEDFMIFVVEYFFCEEDFFSFVKCDFVFIFRVELSLELFIFKLCFNGSIFIVVRVVNFCV